MTTDSSRKEMQAYARVKVRTAIRNGTLKVSDKCEKCGTPNRIVGTKLRRRYLEGHHHKGYEHPLDVLWLCPACHTEQEDCRRMKGALHGNAKLDEETVAIIRKSGLACERLGELLGISTTRIKEARNGTAWSHVDTQYGQHKVIAIPADFDARLLGLIREAMAAAVAIERHQVEHCIAKSQEPKFDQAARDRVVDFKKLMGVKDEQ